MKLILILLAALMSVVSSATPHYHRTRPRVPTARKIVRAVPWKTVLAGGAAAGTIIAAYKVSDGVEEGIKTVAKEKPEVFADSLSVLTWPVRWGILGLFLLVYYWIWRALIRRSPTPTPKG